MTSVLMVFIMVIFVALFFFLVDLGLSALVQFVLSFGG